MVLVCDRYRLLVVKIDLFGTGKKTWEGAGTLNQIYGRTRAHVVGTGNPVRGSSDLHCTHPECCSSRVFVFLISTTDICIPTVQYLSFLYLDESAAFRSPLV